jgi:hypothetical protein
MLEESKSPTQIFITLANPMIVLLSLSLCVCPLEFLPFLPSFLPLNQFLPLDDGSVISSSCTKAWGSWKRAFNSNTM